MIRHVPTRAPGQDRALIPARQPMRASLELLPPTDEKGRVRAVIESPRGTRNKMKCEPDAGVFRITHVLPVGMSFPFDFGFIPGTRAPDGDPLDVLILMDAP